MYFLVPRRKSFTIASAIALLAASLAILSAGLPNAAAAPKDPSCNTYTSATGNKVADYEDCIGKGYVADVAGADATSQATAFAIFKNALTFCTKYPDYKALEKAGWKGEKGLEQGSHWRNPNPDADGSTIATTDDVIRAAAFPNAAVVGEPNARVSQLMWEGSNIAYVGTIPRIHDHQHGKKHEMLHIQCAPTMEGMFGFEQLNNIVPVEELEVALAAAMSGGIEAVSAQLASGEATPAKPNRIISSKAVVPVSPSPRDVATVRTPKTRVAPQSSSAVRKGRIIPADRTATFR